LAFVTATALKPLRRPRLWLSLWCAAIAAVVVGSLLPAMDLPPVPTGADKLEHFAGYGVLAAIAVQLFATRAALWRAGLGLVVLGIALEAAQFLFTSTRMMDGWDALANSLGVLAGLATALTPMRDLLLRLERDG
jgi:VanZ family protein